MSKKDTKFGLDLMQALKEVQAHRRGEIALPSRKVDVISASARRRTTLNICARCLLTIYFGSAIAVTSALAGELSRRDIRRSTEWEPASCNKPSEPNFSVYDIDSFNQSVEEYNSYATDVETYIRCLDAEAADDFSTLRKILEESLSTHMAKAKNDLEQVKSSLENQRP